MTHALCIRNCPGKHLAENSVFVIIANILSLFNISSPSENEPIAEDEIGLKNPSNTGFTPYLIR